MDETSEEEEEEEDDDELDFNNRIKNVKKSKKSEDEKLSENSSSVIGSDKSSTINSKSKLANLVKKGNRSRLIRSMQNLLSYDRSRSNSNDRETSHLNEHKPHKKSKTDLNETPKSGRKKLNEENDSPKDSKSEIFKSIFAKNKWDKKNNQVYEVESSDTPSLINVRKIDSVKRYNTNKLDDTLTVESNSKTVSRKPPIDKRAYKIQCQKPVIQGFLNKRKPQTSSSSTSNLSGLANSSNSSILSGSSGSYSNTNSLLRNHMSRGKWKHYWCVLVKDYMTFYKQPDDKIPKDFLLLKDYNIFSTNHKNGFILFDKMKQVEHEFYANTFEEYQSWYQALIDLRNRLKSESTNSLSNTLSSSGYDSMSSNQTNGSPIMKSDESSSPLAQSLPSSSSTLSRKNNLKLNLSTIMDSNDDPQHQNTSPTLTNVNTSPTLISNYQQSQQNHSYASSRESSPAISNKASRDSSPSMIYQEQDLGFTTSESDAEFYSKAAAGEAVKEVNCLAILILILISRVAFSEIYQLFLRHFNCFILE